MSEGLLDSHNERIKPLIFTATNLSKIAVQAPPERFDVFLDPLHRTLARYLIDSGLRHIHFIAQLMHESGEFRYVEEIADGSAYEGRTDLGNNEPGDGKRFKGRGLIQLTGRGNYIRYSEHTGVDFVRAPTLLKEPSWAVDVAGWYWWDRKLNALADKDDVIAITRKINGGLNGLKDRQHYLERARKLI